MASLGNKNNHFDGLLDKKILRPHMKFKQVEVTEVDFGANGMNTANFINEIMKYAEKAKKSGGFIHLRPKQGADIFTKGIPNTNNPMNNNTNNKNEKDINDKMENDDDMKYESVWQSIPSLNEYKEENVLYEIQKSSNWKVPLFAWNQDHKRAIVKQNKSKKQKSKLSQSQQQNIYREVPNDPLHLILLQNDKQQTTNMNQQNNQNEISNGSSGQKRKNEDEFQSPRPKKRQRIGTRAPSPSLLSYNHNHNNSDSTTTTNTNVSMLIETTGFTIGGGDDDNMQYYNNKDLEFYRGFCCMTHKQEDYKKEKLNKYIEKLLIRMEEMNSTRIPYHDGQKIEDKFLTFLKFLYDEKSTYYGHIDGAKSNGATCYHKNSPFKPEELVKYGPFSCLKPEEYTSGVQTPYIYIGQSHTYFPWHVGMSIIISLHL